MRNKSSELVESFDAQGFVILNNVFKSTDLDEVRRLTEEIISTEVDTDPFEQYYMKHRIDQGTLYDLYQRHPEFRPLAENEEILDVLQQLIGPDIILYENSLVYKPKGKRNEVPWHQDFMNRTDEIEKLIIWVALDDVTIENGALKFIPGSHSLGFQDWYRVKGETHHTRLVLDEVDVSNYEYATMKAGDVLIFHHLVIHGSDRVATNKSRRAYRFSVQSAKEVHTPRATPIVLNGGRPESLQELFSDVEMPEPGPLKKFLHKVGKKLVNI
jgi:phytanoyl-CoA hydroxylase